MTRLGGVGQRMRWVLILGLLTVGASSAVTARQTRADTAQVLLDVAVDLEDRGHHADAYELFRLLARRFADTPAAVEAVQFLDRLRQTGRPGSGTAEFVGWHTALGAILGTLVPAALDADDPEPYGAGLLIGGPLGYGLSRAYTGRRPLTSGQALLMDYASIWGLIQFPMWRDIFDIGDRTECVDTGFDQYCFEIEGEGGVEASILGALTGVGLGVALVPNRPVSSGTALATVFASQWGFLYSLVLRTYADAEDGDAGLAWLAVGGNAGLLAGVFGAPKLDWSPSRVWLVHLAGVAGLVAGAGVALLFDVNDENTNATIFGLSGAVGLAIGVASTSRLEEDARSIGGDPGFQTALFERRDAQWRLGLPIPQPVLLSTGPGTARPFARGLRVSLVKARW